MINKVLLNTVDLFAGCGGLSIGFTNSGFNIITAIDNWEPAIEVYEENIKTHPIQKYDLSNPDAIEFVSSFSPDVIIGGPPCQDFSSAGKRDETLGRADLTIAFANIIKNIKPKFFVMENVDRAFKSNAFAQARFIFKESNYGLTIKIMNASYCGVPQIRKRLFVIGELGGKDNFLKEELENNLSDKPLTIKEYFGDKLNFKHYYRHPRSYARRAIFSVDEPSPTIRGVNRPIPKGYKGHPGDSSPINKDVRPLTTKERCMIQTFPEDFIIKGKKTDIEQIIGNAVPIKLAEFVSKTLYNYIQKKYG